MDTSSPPNPRKDTGSMEVVSEQQDDGTYEIKFQSKEIHLEKPLEQLVAERTEGKTRESDVKVYVGLVAVLLLLGVGAWLLFVSPQSDRPEPPLVSPSEPARTLDTSPVVESRPVVLGPRIQSQDAGAAVLDGGQDASVDTSTIPSEETDSSATRIEPPPLPRPERPPQRVPSTVNIQSRRNVPSLNRAEHRRVDFHEVRTDRTFELEEIDPELLVEENDDDWEEESREDDDDWEEESREDDEDWEEESREDDEEDWEYED